MFQDTRPAELDPTADADAWAEFRVSHPGERLRLLKELRDSSAPVILNTPSGTSLQMTLWAVDGSEGRINFSAADPGAPQLLQVVEDDEAVAVAYLQNVKLQFDLYGFMLVRGTSTSALHCALPREIYRFQRRNAFRVRPQDRYAPRARLRHPAMPEMQLALRVLDVSIGGCALWLPHDVPPLQPGTLLGEVQIELDSETRFAAPLMLQHVGSLGHGHSDGSSGGHRLGCEWRPLSGAAERVLQRWIDRAQQRRRLISLG